MEKSYVVSLRNGLDECEDDDSLEDFFVATNFLGVGAVWTV